MSCCGTTLDELNSLVFIIDLLFKKICQFQGHGPDEPRCRTRMSRRPGSKIRGCHYMQIVQVVTKVRTLKEDQPLRLLLNLLFYHFNRSEPTNVCNQLNVNALI